MVTKPVSVVVILLFGLLISPLQTREQDLSTSYQNRLKGKKLLTIGDSLTASCEWQGHWPSLRTSRD
jgi:hypothetical protein